MILFNIAVGTRCEVCSLHVGCHSAGELALNNLDDQRRHPLGHTPLGVVVHCHTHHYFHRNRISSISLGRYNLDFGETALRQRNLLIDLAEKFY